MGYCRLHSIEKNSIRWVFRLIYVNLQTKNGMNYKGAFLRFLTEAGVVGKVYDNCERPILGELDDDEPRDWLLSLFLFEGTREGAAFWCSVQDKWLNYLEEYERAKE